MPRHETFSQIALLQPEVLNRCQEAIDEARALLGLVLCHVARHDPAWEEQRVVKGRRRRSRDVDRCRRLGFAVQEAIKSAMESYNLDLILVDKGFDYEVALPTADALEDAAMAFEVGPYLLEVKATRTGQARLTPMQAETASRESSRYVLCVVDLRQVSEDELETEWTAARVEPLAKLVPDIGGKVGETRYWVEAARTSASNLGRDHVIAKAGRPP